jgi:hypothetical protein
MRIEWNTGRYYTAEGQRIVAEVLADCVVFYDTARGFGGTVSLPCVGNVQDAAAIQRHVMRCYDRNDYKSTPEDRALFNRIVQEAQQ